MIFNVDYYLYSLNSICSPQFLIFLFRQVQLDNILLLHLLHVSSTLQHRLLLGEPLHLTNYFFVFQLHKITLNLMLIPILNLWIRIKVKSVMYPRPEFQVRPRFGYTISLI